MTTNAYDILVGSPRRGYEDNIKMDLMKTGFEGVNWMHLAT
jgi:hypothetical protein